MRLQKLVLVDKNDKSLGFATYDECHSGKGRRHRAFVTLLFDSKGRVLLQKRKHKLFDGFWDLTAISHPLKINGKIESYQAASDRALKKEMNINKTPVTNVGHFNYFAKDGKHCENEYCVVLIGKYNGKYKHNSDEVYESKWVDFEKFESDVIKNPNKYTPWAKLALKHLNNGDNEQSFKKELEDFIPEFRKYSKAFFQEKKKLIEKYPKLIGNFYDEIEDFGISGKSIRPFLVYLGYKIGGGSNINKKMPICLATELFHNFLLIHDDIIDQSATRRGKPTVHKKLGIKYGGHYGISQAIMTGDIACFEAYDLIIKSSFPSDVRSKCLEVISKVLLETGYGEVLDVEFAYCKPDIKEIWKMMELKTAKYSFVGPLQVGLTLSESSSIQKKAVEDYGLATGCAYQLRDDYLGLFSTEEKIGKSVAADLREGKNTVLFYKTKELARGKSKKTLSLIWGKTNATKFDLQRVQDIMENSGARRWCDQEMNKLTERSKKYVPKITKDKKIQKILIELSDFSINRSK